MKHILFIISLAALSFSAGRAQVAQSLYTDIKAHQVGDVLSVIIVENANATRESKINSSSTSSAAVGAEAKGNVASVLPSVGGSGNISSDYKGQDGTQQNDRLTGRITVRIVEKTEGGMFKIKGERKLGVNGEDNLMQLEGFIRPRDISTNNTVYSYNVADAKIIYRKSGIKNAILAPGTMTKMFTWLIGGLMVAASAGYFAFK